MLRLVNRIYEGAVNPNVWPALVQRLTDFLDSPKGFLFTNFIAPEQGGLNISTGYSQSTLQKWNAHYIPHDVWAQAAVQKSLFKEGAAILNQDLIPDREFVKSKIYRELFEYEDIARVCAGIIFASPKKGVLPTIFGVYRGISAHSYTESDRETMRILVPHLSRALGVMYRLRDAELKVVASLAALDKIDSGVALLDHDGGVRHINRRAEKIFDCDDGLTVRRPKGGSALRLTANDADTQAALEQACVAALGEDVLHVPHFSATIEVRRPSRRQPFAIQFSRLPAQNGFESSSSDICAIGFIVDPAQAAELDSAVLKQLFDLTQAEARLAQCLARGDTLEGAAAHLRISESTARTQIAAVFSKTSTRRQAELMRLLVSLGSTKA